MSKKFDKWVSNLEDLTQMKLSEKDKEYAKRLYKANLSPHEAGTLIMRNE